MATVLICDVVHMYKSSRKTLSNAAILTDSTVMSLTGTSFTVDGVFENKQRTQAIVVLSGDLSNVSYLANTYQIFVFGDSAKSYSGGMYAFGDLNKLCLFVTNSEGFKPEQTQFVVRCNAPTGTLKEMDSSYEGQSASYSQYDQMAFTVNLGASEAREASFIDDSGVNVELMSESAFLHDDDEAIRETLKTANDTMVSARTQLAHVRQSLDGINIAVPALPDWAANDTIEQRDDGTEYIKTDYIFDGLADFDWENCSRLNNYADAAGISADDLKVTLSDNSDRDTQYDVDNESDDVSDDDTADATTDVTDVANTDDSNKVWYYKDNSVIKHPSTSETTLMNQYNSALDAYKQAKVDYQTQVATLIATQNKYLKGIDGYTSNIGSDVIVAIGK